MQSGGVENEYSRHILLEWVSEHLNDTYFVTIAYTIRLAENYRKPTGVALPFLYIGEKNQDYKSGLKLKSKYIFRFFFPDNLHKQCYDINHSRTVETKLHIYHLRCILQGRKLAEKAIEKTKKAKCRSWTKS